MIFAIKFILVCCVCYLKFSVIQKMIVIVTEFDAETA